MSELIERSPEIVTVLDAEVTSARRGEELKQARDWLDRQNLDDYELPRMHSGDRPGHPHRPPVRTRRRSLTELRDYAIADKRKALAGQLNRLI